MDASRSLGLLTRIFTCSLVLAAAGCGGTQPTPTSDTFHSGYAPIFDRAPMEFECPAEKMTYKKLPSDGNQVTAEGCGKRAMYVHAGYTGWVMNTMTTTGASAPVEAPSTGDASAAPTEGSE